MSTASLGGLTFGYDDEGRGDPLVLIHGHPFDRSMWRPQLHQFSRTGWRVIAPDLRGYGESTVVPGRTTLETFARDIGRLLDYLAVEFILLGGLSMGGQIAMEFYRLFPHRVRGLLLADTSAAAETAAGKSSRNHTADRLLREGMKPYADEILPKMVAPHNLQAMPSVAEHVMSMMHGTSPEGAATALRGRAERPDYVDMLPRVAVPTLVVVGNEDEFTPLGDARLIRDGIPGAKLEIIDGAAHMPNLERQAEFNAALDRFATLLSTTAKAPPLGHGIAQPITVVDVFTDTIFGGNPAAVCLLQCPADEAWMQKVAAEMNLPATVFVAARGDGDYDLRWFTPSTELPVCGHGTLAAAHVLGARVRFHTRTGTLTCQPSSDGAIEMDFPAFPVKQTNDVAGLAAALGLPPDQLAGVWSGGEWRLVELRTAADVRAVAPDRTALLTLGEVVIVVVATPGERPGIDSVCRVFEPASGIDEDAVTGSAHCVIAPWLADRTGRTEFTGEQASTRTGTVNMRIAADRVVLSGKAVTVLEGLLHIRPTTPGPTAPRGHSRTGRTT